MEILLYLAVIVVIALAIGPGIDWLRDFLHRMFRS